MLLILGAQREFFFKFKMSSAAAANDYIVDYSLQTPEENLKRKSFHGCLF